MKTKTKKKTAVTAKVRAKAPAPVSEQLAYDIGIDAYIYLYPMITMDVTRRQGTNIEPGKMVGRGPMNAFTHIRAYPDTTFREVVRPNFDTLYSSGWLDLTKGPMVLSVPDTQGRYYMMPMLDMWTNVFAVPGSRTSGTAAANYAIVPPGWKGKLPRGIERIDAPTPYVWIIGRTQTNGPKDYEAVNKLQDKYLLTPLSQWGKKPAAPKVKIDPSVDMKTPPLAQVNGMPAAKYYSYGAELMKLHPPHLADWSMLARLRRIGIDPGQSFSLERVDPVVKRALERAAPDGLNLMKAKVPTLARVVNGWSMNTDTMGAYGIYYLKRAIVAMVGLGANQAEDAVYPLNVCDADGNPLDGNNKYVLHFHKEELPPAGAFWSVTMYDAEGFQAANALDRFAIGDRDPMQYNADGSLDIYVQNESPGQDKETNWLPAPRGPLGVTMRVYAPKAEVTQGRWAPPAIKKVT
jgi:hypothetical protein